MKYFKSPATTRLRSALWGILFVVLFVSAASAADKEVIVLNDELTPVPVRDVNNPSHRSIQHYAYIVNNTDPVTGLAGAATLMTVPADSRLVIEFVSAECQSGLGEFSEPPLEATVLRITSGLDHYFSFDYSRTLDDGQVTFITSVATHMTRLYADPGTEVLALISPTTSTARINCNVSISGYLTDP